MLKATDKKTLCKSKAPIANVKWKHNGYRKIYQPDYEIWKDKAEVSLLMLLRLLLRARKRLNTTAFPKPGTLTN